ncbi:MAG: hypothetical protein ABWX85_09420 [Arthrobacter sp.]
MRGNPIIGIASTHPFHRSGPISGYARRNGTKAEQLDRPDENGQERRRVPLPVASGQAVEGLLADELADVLWKRHVPGPDQPRLSANQRSAQSSGLWWDQQLAEIEDLAGELKTKIAHYALFRATESPHDTTGPTNDAAVAWMHETLEDIAATALGIEIASQELFLRAGTAEGLESIVGRSPEERSPVAEQASS